MLPVRVFCASDHPRAPMEWRPDQQYHVCPQCLDAVTEEAVLRAIPKQYRPLADLGWMGEMLAAMMDVGAIDVIYTGSVFMSVEYPRENQV